MPTYVALLRGINVGKAKRVPMAELRALLEALGYTDVATLLNSGNAVFRAPGRSAAKLATTIAGAITARLAIHVPVIVKSAQELATIAAENPIRIDEALHSRLLVAFVQDTDALRSVAMITPLVTPAERFVVGNHAAYLYCANGILESRAGEALLGKAGRVATTRNWATVLKLLALVT
jgi:uncharacterized protein (DUF1697 family)